MANSDNKPFISGFLVTAEGSKKELLASDFGQIYPTVDEAIEDAEAALNIGDGDTFFIVPITMDKPEKYKLSFTAVKVTTSSASKDEDSEQDEE